MRRKPLLAVMAMGMVFSLVAAACSSNKTHGSNNSSAPGTGGGKAVKGGVFRTAIEDFGFTGAFDPTGEYLGTAFGLYSQLMLRNLVTYKHVEGAAGDVIVPDLATDTGQV